MAPVFSLKNVLTVLGFGIVFWTAWSLDRSNDDQQQEQIYCTFAFALILFGQLSGMRLQPALLDGDIKSPPFEERAAVYEFRSVNKAQTAYQRRAQKAAGKK